MELFFAPIFDRTFKSLDKPVKRLVKEEIQRLKNEPELGEPLSGILHGLRSLHVKGYGSNYRVVYKVSKDKTKVVVIAAGTHKIYDMLENYLRNVLRVSGDLAFEP